MMDFIRGVVRHAVLAWVGGLVAVIVVVGVMVLVLPLPLVIAVSRAVALVTVVHLIWNYHRLAAWSEVPVGRSTMAIKGAILILTVAANIRTWENRHGLLEHAYELPSVAAWAEIGIALGWSAMALALVQRDLLVTRLHGRTHGHVVPAKDPAIWPVEERRDEDLWG